MRVATTCFMLCALTLLVCPSDVAAASWQLDKAHTRVGFSVSHLGINTVHGAFKKFSAEVSADDAGKLTSVSAEVAVNSVDTGIEKRDEHLRAEDVFDAAKYPKMRLKTSRIVWSGERFSGTAELTIKGKTLPVKFKGKRTGTKRVTTGEKTEVRVGYTVSAIIDRTAFGLTFGGFSEGLGMVGESVSIALNVELVRPE